MAERKVDFAFITEDVKRQRELAQQALDEAKRIDGELQDEADEARKQRLREAKSKWLAIARELAENAVTTSQAASSAISTISNFISG